MRRVHILRGVATFVIALSLVTGFSVSVNAEKYEQTEMTNLGVQAASSISIDHVVQNGQVTKKWFIKVPKVPEGCELYFNIYEGTEDKTQTGYWNKEDDTQYFNAYYDYTLEAGEEELVIDNDDFTMGKKTVVSYLYDETSHQAAGDAHRAAYRAARDKAREAYYKALDDYWDGVLENRPNRDDYYNGLDSFDEYCEKNNIVLNKAAFIVKSTNALSIEVKKVASVSVGIKSTSVELSMYEDSVTGYEIYRKFGKKYKKIATVAKNVYVDKNLLSKTKYSYKVRPYYYNEDTGKTSYGYYKQIDATTSGSNLNLKLNISGKKNVKLTWNKIPGAIRYEIYRRVNVSNATAISKGVYNRYYSYELIKTLKKKSKSYTDKKTVANKDYQYCVVAILSENKKMTIEESEGIAIEFNSPVKIRDYCNAKGDRTIEWKQVYGADGYLIKKRVDTYNVEKDDFETEYVEVAKQGRTKTKRTFKAPKTEKKTYTDKNGEIHEYWTVGEHYRIYAYKNGGKVLSDEYTELYVYSTLGVVSKVSAKKVENGIQVSWTPVSGASYYEVYRVKAGSLIKDNDNGSYICDNGVRVSEYVGAKTPVKIDVAAWNAERDAYQKDKTLPKPTLSYYKLNPEKTYYYRNYEYIQNKFTKTSMIDYAGDIIGRWSYIYEEDGKYVTYPIRVDSDDNNRVGPKEGVTYQYYVVAIMDEEKGINDYTDNEEDGTAQDQYIKDRKLYAVVPGTIFAQLIEKPRWKGIKILSTAGCKKIGTATYTTINTPKKTSIKSLKAGKKSVKLTIKKVKGAKSYRIYRATKKKGRYQYIGSTSKIKFTDKGLKSGKKYYYRVVVVKENEAKADLVSPASKVKSVKVK